MNQTVLHCRCMALCCSLAANFRCSQTSAEWQEFFLPSLQASLLTAFLRDTRAAGGGGGGGGGGEGGGGGGGGGGGDSLQSQSDRPSQSPSAAAMLRSFWLSKAVCALVERPADSTGLQQLLPLLTCPVYCQQVTACILCERQASHPLWAACVC